MGKVAEKPAKLKEKNSNKEGWTMMLVRYLTTVRNMCNKQEKINYFGPAKRVVDLGDL